MLGAKDMGGNKRTFNFRLISIVVNEFGGNLATNDNCFFPLTQIDKPILALCRT